MLRWIRPRTYGLHANQTHRSTAEVVSNTVGAAPGYHDGELESLRAELKQLTYIVAAMADMLTPQQQRELVEQECYGWEESKGE